MKNVFELGKLLGRSSGKASQSFVDNYEAIETGLDGVANIAKAYGRYIKLSIKESFDLRNNLMIAKSILKNGVSTTFGEIMRGTMEGLDEVFAESLKENAVLDEEQQTH